MPPEHEKPWAPLTVAEVAALFAALPVPWWLAGGYAIELVAGRPAHLRPWPVGESLAPAVHDAWCRDKPAAPWRLQVMLDEVDAATGWWRSRRDVRITRPVRALAAPSAYPLPVLAPEIQLLSKGRQPRPKDELDFGAALPAMTASQRGWLHDALVTAYGPLHAWLPTLAGEPSVEPRRRRSEPG